MIIVGADNSGLGVTCAICVVSKKLEFCIEGGTVGNPEDLGQGYEHFSCLGNDMPSYRVADCKN